MSYVPVTQLRRKRKKKSIVIQHKTLLYVIFQISICSIMLLIPVLSQSFVEYINTLLSLCTLFFFGGMVVYLSIRLVILFSDWVGKGKHAMGANHSAVQDESSRKNSVGLMIENILSIAMLVFLLILIEPFITAVIWWQGYKLMAGKAVSLVSITETFTFIEYLVQFGMIGFLILIIKGMFTRGALPKGLRKMTFMRRVPVKDI